MTEFIVGVGSALWLGVLTSISPCPLATNIAAISYIGRKVGNSRHVFLTGLLYTLGRTLAYVALAFVLVATVLSVPQISMFLQKYMHLVIGPLLLIVGMFLMGLIQLELGGGGIGQGLQQRVDALGIWGSLLLGVVFALTFCPTSAALPVLVFAVLLATSAQSVGRAYNALAKIEWWARMGTGGIFILVGIYFSLAFVFEVI